jgi:Domain of unknown function (DUF3883)
LLDAAVRKKIEKYAEAHAAAHFSAQGWQQVEPVGHLKLGYDLTCQTERGQILHVEVKGTQTAGEYVILTGREARHVKDNSPCDASHALYVVSQITVSHEGGLRCSGGQANCAMSWVIDDDDLIATEYSYRVPHQAPSAAITAS